MNYLAPFRSRSEAFRLERALKERRIAATIINTPRSLGVSCGLTVLFNAAYLDIVRETIATLKLTGSQGIFKK